MTKEKDPSKLSKRKQGQIIDIAEAIEAREWSKQRLVFSPRDFVLFGLPHKRLKGGLHVRRNGNAEFTVQGHPKLGVPFGQDRLLPIWLATAYKIMGSPRNRIIWFRSASDILRAFGWPTDGLHRHRLRQRFERWTRAFFSVSQSSSSGRGFRIESFHLIERAELWFHPDSHPNQTTLWRNGIQLSERFVADLDEAVVPVDLNTLRALKENTGALDLYVWQAWRSFAARRARRDIRIPVFGPGGLVEQLGSSVQEQWKLRQLLRGWQTLVKATWPTCPNELTADGNTFIIRPGHAIRNATLELPGVSPEPPAPLRLQRFTLPALDEDQLSFDADKPAD